jgi:hypothetical protein
MSEHATANALWTGRAAVQYVCTGRLITVSHAVAPTDRDAATWCVQALVTSARPDGELEITLARAGLSEKRALRLWWPGLTAGTRSTGHGWSEDAIDAFNLEQHRDLEACGVDHSTGEKLRLIAAITTAITYEFTLNVTRPRYALGSARFRELLHQAKAWPTQSPGCAACFEVVSGALSRRATALGFDQLGMVRVANELARVSAL